MASLKEVRNRISSVQTTQKITRARQMVASAQLHRAQASLESARRHNSGLQDVLAEMADYLWTDSPLAAHAAKGKTAVVVFGSNSGMCGPFNTLMEKEILSVSSSIGHNLVYYPVGKKIRQALSRSNLHIAGNYDHLVDSKVSMADILKLADDLTQGFLKGRIKRVELFYYDFKSIRTQTIIHRTMLPVPLPKRPMVEGNADYIIEPGAEALTQELLTLSVKAGFYADLISTRTSEQAARLMAMQMATENANEILEQLQLTKNKLRQQIITAELLDIVGSSFA